MCDLIKRTWRSEKYWILSEGKRDTLLRHFQRKLYLKPNKDIKSWCYANNFLRSYNYYERKLDDTIRHKIHYHIGVSVSDDIFNCYDKIRIDISCRYGILLKEDDDCFLPLDEDFLKRIIYMENVK